jgi:hypothetical protein
MAARGKLMCDCKISWVQDPDVEGSHNRVPFTCREYIGRLETALLKAAVELGADSNRGREALKALKEPPHGTLLTDRSGEVTGLRVTTFGISQEIGFGEVVG